MLSQTQRGAHRSPGSCSQYLDKSNDRISCHEVFTILSGDPQLQLSTSLLESHGANCELEFRSQLSGRKLEILLKETCYFFSVIYGNYGRYLIHDIYGNSYKKTAS